ncbi:kinesin light chain 1 [Paraphoma chrysanthemicola]|nr:kinesin light chain 1 [Paraphoma chrysanthemicola]
MRLVQRNEDGTYSLTEFIGDAIPRYAILSHTWGEDFDEVTLADLERATGTTKAGYRKLEFCADQAAKDGLRYFWVDTCAIDKSSSAELSEAINSMFKWYRNAARCYVYLSDVSIDSITSSLPALQDWYPALQQSRWFTRGWTLQELVAPESVEFFSVQGVRLGDKTSLLHELHGITGISIDALQGTPLNGFSVEERMSWVGQRKTKREEDIAYSLLGIFDVHMPLIYGEGRGKAFARLKRELNACSDEKRATYTHRPARTREAFSTLPFAPDPDFVDRPEMLAWLRDKCAGPGARAALVGLGGVGKSQLAIRYANSIRDASPHTFVFWVHASTRVRFDEAYRAIADRLQLPGRDSKANVLRLVGDWLRDEANGRWVMVLDNVDDAETFFPPQKRQRDEADTGAQIPLATYLPQSRNGAILVTSRNKDVAARLVGGYNKIKEVLAMDESEGLQLLRNKLCDPPIEESAVELLRTLDCIPLAISQAAAYINRRARMTVTSYLDEFRKSSNKRESLLNQDMGDLRRDESAFNSVVTTWQMSFEQIRRERRSAADLLSLMSCFNPQGIPESTLRRYSRDAAKKAAEDGEDEEGADSAFNEDLDMLRAYSLVSMTADGSTCEMHALVRFCTQVWLSSSSDAEQWKQQFVELMAQELPNGDFENWAKCRQLLPHVEPLFDSEPAAEEALKAWAKVLTNAAWYLEEQGKYSTAQQIAARALTARETTLGLDSQETLDSVDILAWILIERGKYEEAEKLNRRALEGRERQLGQSHSKTLYSVNNLAVTLDCQGEFGEAETLHRRALEGREKALDAETLHRLSLEGRERELGHRHPVTLLSLYNLAVVLHDQGQYEEAEKLYRRALEGRVEELGNHHPNTLTSLHSLALVLDEQDQYEEAEKLYRRSLEGSEKELGHHHPDTLTSLHNLAGVLYEQGQYEEAEKFYQQALEGKEKELGALHRETLISVHCLAQILHRLHRYTEAAKLYQRACDGYTQVLGSMHSKTMRCRNDFDRMQQEMLQAGSSEGNNQDPIATGPASGVEMCEEEKPR